MRFYLVSYLLECIALALVFKLWLDNLKLKDTDRLTYTVHMICYNIYDTLSFYIIILGFRNIIVSNMLRGQGVMHRRTRVVSGYQAPCWAL